MGARAAVAGAPCGGVRGARNGRARFRFPPRPRGNPDEADDAPVRGAGPPSADRHRTARVRRTRSGGTGAGGDRKDRP